ncbi:MAG TPA: hypothetical protein VN811_01310 [Thermoanaerobaculia bacterium]|nr:hypothetical protein [Thermoanaerobaculia bacterium]HXT49645.1 hypothetical protein [Thermoanaerobaculia bacterium]
MKRRRTGASDTSPAIAAMLMAANRALTSQEKVRQVLDCNEVSEAMALAGLRARHPEASDRELRLRLAAQRLGRPLMIAAFGWDPERSGDG